MRQTLSAHATARRERMTHRARETNKFRLMRTTKGKAAAAIVAACAWMCLAGASAQAQISFAPCGNSNDFACGHVTVPLDPTGATAGTLTLALRRHRAPVGEARSAIIALAGGPGQPALPFAEQFAELFGPIASTRDLVAFDQRGIGLSQPLSCHAFERPGLFNSIGALIESCTAQLGPTRTLYTTADTVADIEAIRVAGGYEKLVLYGTSYGTKVAEQYAQDYPNRVEALILDSVVTPSGPDPLDRATFTAIPRVLRQICANGTCAHVTPDPVADLAKVARSMRRKPLRGRAIDGEGKAHALSMSSDELVGLLLAGDFSPLLRAEFVTTLRSAADGDTAPLARLLATASSAGGEGQGEDFDTPLYYATSCEEQDFPWSRTATPSARVAQATAVARALPASALAPFDASNAIDLSDILPCAHWPFTTPAPAVNDAPLPNVPTLILSGADDLRTPTANAREVSAQIPDANLLVVPYTGHSVLGGEPTACAREALLAMFANGVGGSVKPCRATPEPGVLRPLPPAPSRLGLVSVTRGYPGRTGRTLRTVALTLYDFARQLALRLGALSPSELIVSLPTLRVGGLRAGWGQFAGGGLSFSGYSYVPGVSISGTLKGESATLRIGGGAGSDGTLRLGAHGTLAGTLGGRRVQVKLSGPEARAAIVGLDAQASSHLAAGGTAVRGDAHRLAGVLGRILQP
jgi:pimeloyl-ACP methyl ester carboxylesterase